MKKVTGIRLLASGNNERGDLFTRLVRDLFFAMGYDDLRINVHKSGRELDLQGQHRLEPRRVVGECKAHATKVGGDDLNKFLGVLTRERTKSATIPVAGYFVSLSGFTETGIDQEAESGDDRIVLLTAERVVSELESSRVIVTSIDAAERAGHCAQHANLGGAVLDGAELLGHQRGYIWAVFYAEGKERIYFSLIHADGTALAETVAREVVEADRLCNGTFHSLKYLAPPPPPVDRVALATSAAESYRRWLAEEFGYIHLDGMPADTDLSATRLKLERLFVPLKVSFPPKSDGDLDSEVSHKDKTTRTVGEVLETIGHLALLAMPGGGKSTLVKRLAMAYAFPERREGVGDDLPQRDWLPLVLRCRELRDRAHRPITELLDDIPLHAGMTSDESTVFRDSVRTALRCGQALLLIDGLDEISDEGARQTFAKHLRTFLAMFPQVALVVTSREAGFRLVAGVVASACEQAKLAPLDEEDVLNLCERWHVEVVGDTAKVRADAKELAAMIWDDYRIRTLAENPLLLTTLLVVKRSLRELPRSRTALYREAIRVLVRTWNVEGYAPLDEDETLAQLSYVGCAMMQEGKQQIGQKSLLKLLQGARQELEPELQFARISPQEFINRIEYRSSLLMQTGHERIGDVLEPVFEFRHLTFQEYLAARGYVEEQYPGRDDEQSLADVLELHFTDERWREVIALAAVLAGRKAEELTRRLIVASNEYSQSKHADLGPGPPLIALSLCVRDEVQVTLPTLRNALKEVARLGDREFQFGFTGTILRGKFGAVFKDVVEEVFLAGGPRIEEYASSLARTYEYARFGDQPPEMSDVVVESLLKGFDQGNRVDRINAALVSMMLAFRLGQSTQTSSTRKADLAAQFQALLPGLNQMLNSADVPSVLSASWALAWFGQNRVLAGSPAPDLLLSLYSLWRKLEWPRQARFLAWALGAQKLLPRDTFDSGVWGECDSFLRTAAAEGTFGMTGDRGGALVVGWYRRSPWSDTELVQEIVKDGAVSSHHVEPTARELLEHLGDAGRDALREYERERPRPSKIGVKPARKKS